MGARAEHDAMSGGERGGRNANLRTALILLTVAAAFFAGIIVKFWLFG